MEDVVLSVRELAKVYRTRGRRVTALENVSFDLRQGETLGLVGPSGSGKSTLARVLMRLTEPDTGSVMLAGEDWLALSARALRRRRATAQMVFQDPLAAFNPRTTIGGALDDPLRIHAIVGRAERPRRIAELLERVGLPAAFARRRIHEISGGQRQRVAIARALATNPRLIVLDEAVSALDVSVRGTILALLADLQEREGLAYIFVGHDLAVVRVISHRVAVMDAGRIVETGPVADVVANPQSATAKALVAATPRLG
ncbi:peptide/nickel transport system ATP-binding protein [Amorphus suaedae]